MPRPEAWKRGMARPEAWERGMARLKPWKRGVAGLEPWEGRVTRNKQTKKGYLVRLEKYQNLPKTLEAYLRCCCGLFFNGVCVTALILV